MFRQLKEQLSIRSGLEGASLRMKYRCKSNGVSEFVSKGVKERGDELYLQSESYVSVYISDSGT